MFLSVLLIIFQFSKTLASHLEYPVHIHELGDFVVERPILENRPDDAVILPPPSFPAALQRPRSIQIISQPALLFPPLEAVSTYLMENTVPRMIKFVQSSPGKAFWFSEEEIHFINALKYHADHYNPSIFEGINEIERIVAFGAVFLRIFKVSYPGLFCVRLRRQEIIDLAVITTGWFMDFEEENTYDKDYFLSTCLKIYSPNSSSGFNLSLYELYAFDKAVAFEAAVQMNLKRIRNRNEDFLLPDLKAKNTIYLFLYNREIFLRLLPGVRNINDAEHGYSRDRHILFAMIRSGIFYPETMLRHELKDFRIGYWDQNYFEDFYSEALYIAILNRNTAAITFLLNLDNCYYEVERPEPEENDYDSDSDSSIDTVATPYSVNHPRPISPETLNSLRLIFLNDQVLELFPDVYNFAFCNFTIFNLMEAFKNAFPNLMLLQQNYNRLIEERYRDRVPRSPTVGKKRSHDFDRSNSPPTPK